MVKHVAGVVAALLIVAVCLAGEPQRLENHSKKVVNKAGTPSASTSLREKQARLRGKSATPASNTDQPVRWVGGKPLPWPWDDMPYRTTRPGDGC